MRTFKKLAVTAAVVSLGLASCSSSDSSGSSSRYDKSTTTTASKSTTPPAGGTTVSIKGFAFAPASLEVKVGDTVTWTNNDSPAHTVSSDDGVTPAFDTGDLKPGTTGTVTFGKAGTYAYHCNIHSSMHGTIVVTK